LMERKKKYLVYLAAWIILFDCLFRLTVTGIIH